jgi:hypothetical protein
MKKRPEKLSLNKETLRNLSERDLQQPVGGASVKFCPSYYETCTESGCPPTWGGWTC